MKKTINVVLCAMTCIFTPIILSSCNHKQEVQTIEVSKNNTPSLKSETAIIDSIKEHNKRFTFTPIKIEVTQQSEDEKIATCCDDCGDDSSWKEHLFHYFYAEIQFTDSVNNIYKLGFSAKVIKKSVKNSPACGTEEERVAEEKSIEEMKRLIKLILITKPSSFLITNHGYKDDIIYTGDILNLETSKLLSDEFRLY